MPDEYDAYESAAKEDAANGVNTVLECYVAGLDPTNATDVFRTVISIGADGAPVVGWDKSRQHCQKVSINADLLTIIIQKYGKRSVFLLYYWHDCV